MTEPSPEPTRRPTARLILVDPDDRILLFCCRNPFDATQPAAWITPGGGVESGESLTAAAVRELHEETGIAVTEQKVGRPVAVASGVWGSGAVRFFGIDWFFFLRVADTDVDTSRHEPLEQSTFIEHRWWTLTDLAGTDSKVIPPGLADLLRTLLDDGPPTAPVTLPWHLPTTA